MESVILSLPPNTSRNNCTRTVTVFLSLIRGDHWAASSVLKKEKKKRKQSSAGAGAVTRACRGAAHRWPGGAGCWLPGWLGGWLGHRYLSLSLSGPVTSWTWHNLTVTGGQQWWSQMCIYPHFRQNNNLLEVLKPEMNSSWDKETNVMLELPAGWS